jgi:hypothetical protein
MKRLLTLAFLIAFAAPILRGQDKGKHFDDKFRQLEEILPTPNTYRTGSGAPGHEYWQQQADYKMSLTLNDEKQPSPTSIIRLMRCLIFGCNSTKIILIKKALQQPLTNKKWAKK